MQTPKNARGRPVTKLCLALEAFRRTDEGRIRDAKAFLTHFFPQDKTGAKDRIFYHMPNEVRADLLSNWGIRGKKSALRDDDDRVRNTVNDALNAGDIDATVIEEGISPEILTDWIPLEDWWVFWRGSNLPIGSVRKALALARDLSLFDERWFLEHLALKSPKLDGIDVVCNALSKEQIVAWIGAVHSSGDASPNGLVSAVGWETILAKTAHEGLLFALDALARQIGLTETGPDERKSDMPRAKSDLPPVNAPALASRKGSEPPEPPPTPRMEVPARISARPPEPRSPEPPPVVPAAASTPSPTPVTAKAAEPKVPDAAPTPPAIPSTPASSPASATAPTSAKPVSKQPPPIPPGASKAPPVPAKGPPPIPPGASKAPPVPGKGPPPIPSTSKGPPPIPSQQPAAQSKPPARSVAPPVQDLPSVIIEDDPFFPAPPQAASSSQMPAAPASTPPNARSLFLGAAAEPPPMRPPAATIIGVAPEGSYGTDATDDVAMPNFSVPPLADPEWAPPKAEPGDMGWDLVHGVTRPMGMQVQAKYNFSEEDDEPTSEIRLPGDIGRR